MAATAAAQVHTLARPAVRINTKVDNAVTTSLPGTHPAVVEHAAVGARVAPGTLLKSMRLVLTPSDEQVASLHTLMAEQQDKTSPNYHQWLTPETFGQFFGAASPDIAKVTAWLQDQGFTIDEISKSNRIITFSGSVGQVEAAFHTTMNNVTVNGEAHISNTTDVTIPSALASVVKGLVSLNNFFPQTHAKKAGIVQLPVNIPAGNYVTANASDPQFGSSPTGTHYIAPGDAAVIFNSAPLVSSGIDGTGQSIAVLARSNVTLSDVQAFRTLFGLKKNDPKIIQVGQDPGQNGDDDEAYLDIEWAGAMAPSATVNFIVAGPSLISGGTDAAGIYAVNNNIGDIISLSYGGCETNFTATYTAFYNQIWEQAAAQGQTVFVSSGDSGAAGCDSSSAAYSTAGYGVNALGSSAYNVAVGGTMFVDYGPAQYWGTATGIPYTSALSYIPEAVLNQGRLTTTYLNSAATAAATGSGIFSTGGGISVYTARPSWQTGSGITTADPVPSAGGTGWAVVSDDPGYTQHRLVPDLSLISASGHDGSLFCGEGICALSATNTLANAGIIGGTSVATPVMASMQALINQKNGGRQGNANYFYYPLGNNDYVAGNCQAPIGTAANPTVTLPAATCNFHDVVAGSNIVPTASTGTAGIGFSGTVGFDEGTGLGSLNAFNLANNWSTVSMRATTTSFTLSPTLNITHGTSQKLTVKVAPTSGTGTPTGDFSVIAETTTPYTTNQFTLSGGSFNGSLQFLPGGSYNVHVHYAGDGTFGPSDSPSIPVVITKENSVVYAGSYYVSTTGGISSSSSFNYGQITYIDAQVLGVSGSNSGLASGLPVGTVPTGTMTFSITRNGSAIAPLTVNLDTYGDAFFEATGSYANYYLKSNYGALTPGSYVFSISYSGDNSFNPASTSVSLTVGRLTPTATLSGPTNISSGQSSTYTFSIPTPTSLSTPASGTVTFVDTTTSSTLGTATVTNGVATFTTTGITATGANTITATYGGDVNYAGTTASTTTTVGTASTDALTLTTTGTLTVNSAVSLRATFATATTGTVQFFDGSTLIATASSSTATTVIAASYNGFTAGTHNLTAVFLGNTTYTQTTATLTITIAQYTTGATTSVPVLLTYGQVLAAQIELTYTGSTLNEAIVPTGTVTLFVDGVAAASTTTFIFESGYNRYGANVVANNITGGTHSVYVSYSGDANFRAVSGPTYSVTVAPLTPAATLSSPSVVYSRGSAVTLTVLIPAASNLAAPTGTLTFYDGTTSLGTATFVYSASAGGFVASITTTALGGGAHSITAQLIGDANYNSTTSAVLVITIPANNVWVANSNGTVSGLTQSGTSITSSGVAGGGTAISIDNSGNIWSVSKSASNVVELSNTGATKGTFTGGGINAPTAVTIDGAGYIWITNGNNTLSVLTPSGTPFSNTAYTSLLSGATSINVDGSGNLWITNATDNSVSEVIGAASPVTTPTTTAVKNNTVAAKP